MHGWRRKRRCRARSRAAEGLAINKWLYYSDAVPPAQRRLCEGCQPAIIVATLLNVLVVTLRSWIRQDAVMDRRLRCGLQFCVLAFAALLFAPACGAGGRTSLALYAGGWSGHDRGLKISRSGVGSEEYLSGCCNVVIDVKFRLSNPRGTRRSATATATVTFVRVWDKTWFTKADPPPHLGERRTLRLRDGVLTEPLVGTDYCDPTAEGQGKCGA